MCCHLSFQWRHSMLGPGKDGAQPDTGTHRGHVGEATTRGHQGAVGRRKHDLGAVEDTLQKETYNEGEDNISTGEKSEGRQWGKQSGRWWSGLAPPHYPQAQAHIFLGCVSGLGGIACQEGPLPPQSQTLDTAQPSAHVHTTHHTDSACTHLTRDDRCAQGGLATKHACSHASTHTNKYTRTHKHMYTHQ